MFSEVANLGRRAPVRRRRYTGSDWKNIWRNFKKWKGIGDRLVRRLLEEQDTVFGCYHAAKWGNKVGQSGGGEETGQTHT